MDKVYALLFSVACILLLIDAFAGSSEKTFVARLLPLGLFFAVLVWAIQAWKSI